MGASLTGAAEGASVIVEGLAEGSMVTAGQSSGTILGEFQSRICTTRSSNRQGTMPVRWTSCLSCGLLTTCPSIANRSASNGPRSNRPKLMQLPNLLLT
jgi:hypothetical protein